MNIKGAKILVLGGTGFIGCHLISRLESLGHEVTSISMHHPHSIMGRSISAMTTKFYVKDIANFKKIGDYEIFQEGWDYVINLAGYVDHSAFSMGGIKPLQEHLLGTIRMLEQLHKNGIKRFIQVGSSDEYGDALAPQSEDMLCRPMSPYAFAKYSMSNFLQMLFRSENFPSVILRPFLLYGPWQNYNRLIPQIIKSAIKNEVLNASPGEQMRDFCYIDDAIDAILSSMNANQSVNGEIFNIGTGSPIKVRDLISTVFSMVGSGNVNFSAYAYKNGENMALYANISKSKHVLGWEAKTDLATGLRKTINFYNKQST